MRLWWVRADGVGRVIDPPEAEARRAVELLAGRYPQHRREPPLGRGARGRRHAMVGLGCGRWPSVQPRLVIGIVERAPELAGLAMVYLELVEQSLFVAGLGFDVVQ